MKIAGVLMLAGVLVMIWWGVPDDPQPSSRADKPQPEEGTAKPHPGPESGSSGVRLIEGNPFIEDYGNEEGSIRSDLESLRDIVRDCQLLMKDFDRYHLPGNPEITRFLQGDNPDRLAWIPPGHGSVDEGGELLDRHGTPVFFHRLSGMRFEYRSAGPDRKHWTDDDVVVK